jgi:hypothetical protein
MKKTFKLAVVVMAIMMVASLSMAQEKALALIPGDAAMIGEIDFPTLNEFMAKNSMVKDQAQLPPFVMDLLGKADKAFFGVDASAMMGGQPEDMYFVVTGNLKTAEIMKIAQQVAAKEGKKISFTNVNVAGLNAVKGQAEGGADEDMLMADFPGGIVFGQEKGLAKFVAVKGGQTANAASNANLMKVRSGIPANYGFKLYGTPGDMGGMQIDSFKFGMGLKSDIMSLLLSLTSTDPAALQQISQSVMMMKGMAGMADESGKLAEVLEQMKVNNRADGIDLTLDVPLKVLEEVAKNMQAQAGAGM